MRSLAIILIVLWIVVIAGGCFVLIDEMTGYDKTIRDKCVDNYYREFDDEYCSYNLHCGAIMQIVDKRCDNNQVRIVEEEVLG